MPNLLGVIIMTTVHFDGAYKIRREFIGYTKKEVLSLAKKYGIDHDCDQIYIPDYQLLLTRRGNRWYQ